MHLIDLRAELASLPRHPAAQRQDDPLTPRSITFHFSDVITTNRSFAAERRRLVGEAQYQLRRSWAGPEQPPIYGSRYQYHYVVFSEGQIAWCNDLVDLWHCGNMTGNARSISTHVMLGRGQQLTDPQRASLYALWDWLRGEHAIPRGLTVGHCEWPRGDGAPVTSPTFRPQPRQSSCPERVLFRDLAAYRGLSDGATEPAPLYRAKATSWIRPLPRLGVDRTSTLAQGALIRVLAIEPGDFVRHPVYGTGDQWARTERGYIWLNQLEQL